MVCATTESFVWQIKSRQNMLNTIDKKETKKMMDYKMFKTNKKNWKWISV